MYENYLNFSDFFFLIKVTDFCLFSYLILNFGLTLKSWVYLIYSSLNELAFKPFSQLVFTTNKVINEW